jgi:hypothetical protein
MSAAALDAPRGWPSAQVSLDGSWQLVPGDHPLAGLDRRDAVPIDVPGLWEEAGHLDLDGVAWYRREFTVEDPEGWWTLHCGAVMDDADVYLNGRLAGSHRGGFTPFDLDCSGLVAAANKIAIRVTDHPAGSPAHLRSAHGKQGWMNDVFGSPPSLYLTYGGIWQSMWLERHGPARIADCWVNGDPHDLAIEVTAAGHAGADAMVTAEVLGRRATRPLPRAGEPVRFRFGQVNAALWSPQAPVLHEATVHVHTGGALSHTRRVRFGLRTLRLGRTALELNGVPVKMRSALVQGFSARTLYGGQSRAEAEAEVRAALDLGLTTLRLHIKAFDPVYLDVCDELGMLVHCDIPVAEPIAHDELGPDGPVAEQCAEAAVEQVRRDRSHPSIVLWSAMNELGAEQLAVRATAGYEGFARRLFEAVRAADPTRPVIENDWIEPDPDRVFASPLLTAHWYGRLSRTYLATLRAKTEQWAATGRPLLVSEFGDWGLPAVDDPGGEPFWWYGPALSRLVESTPWQASVADFIAATQRYQGLADRLQIELFRQVPGVLGWCLTELTDVPQEFNGLFDLLRNPKSAAIAEVRRAAQPLCPILMRPHWAARTGDEVTGDLIVVNDGPAIRGAELMAGLAGEQWHTSADLPAHAVVATGRVTLACPAPPGDAVLSISVTDHGRTLGSNLYPVRVVAAPRAPLTVAVPDDPRLRHLLTETGAALVEPRDAATATDLLVIGEQALGPRQAEWLAGWLDGGGRALLLAQDVEGPLPLPADLSLTSLETAWGSTPFIFTTTEPALPSLPAATVLATELLSAAPDYIYGETGGAFAGQTAVGVLKPPPGPLTGTAVGRLHAGGGLLTLCQLLLVDNGCAGDPLAVALLGDLLRWAADLTDSEPPLSRPGQRPALAGNRDGHLARTSASDTR